jgi:hypothetical protein
MPPTGPSWRALAPVVPRTGLWAPVLACFALAAISLLEPSAPTYDPWAWIIWGREVMHLDLDTVSGPSWKPLPVLLTAPFSLLGDDASPALWLVVARAGSLGALVVTYRLGARLAGVAAGLLAALLLLASPWVVRNGLLGNSEGLLILFVVWSVERHVAGRHGQAFALAIAAGMLRPEAWPFIGLYALWLVWRDGGRLPWVAGGLALLPLLWLLPELWGSGDLWRASERANTPNPNSAAFSDRPAFTVLGNWALLLTPPAWVGMAAALVLALRGERLGARLRRPLRPSRRVGGSAAIGTPRSRRIGPTGGIALLAVGWLVLVAVMTEAGYSGNQRYLLAPTGLLYVVGAVGLVRLAATVMAHGPGRIAAAALAVLAIAGSAIWAADRMPFMLRDVRFQARVAQNLDVAIDEAGGRAALLRCGTPFTNRYLVQLVAWKLHVHGKQVLLQPEGRSVMLRARHALMARAEPPQNSLEGSRTRRLAAKTSHWRIETACGA